jgi:phosphoribosylaminoimidazole-succinocarboxamide synthase
MASDLPLPLLHRGKVRDVYEAGPDELLMLASDRVSAFDVVLPQAVPRKGEVLTMLTAWWLHRLEREPDGGVGHHLVSADPDRIVELHPELAASREQWARRAMLVRRTDPVPVECVVRGYLSGSAWREYRDHGTLAGEPLEEGMVESQALPGPLFSPATKAARGRHDVNIPVAAVADRVGAELADALEQTSLRVYEHGRRTCEERGIILADTKFELGHDRSGELLLIDEVMTPDSSRFWPRESYEPGHGQPSLDKQPIRDWLDARAEWDKRPPPPDLSPEVVEATTDRYLEIFRRLTGMEVGDYRPPRTVNDGAAREEPDR